MTVTEIRMKPVAGDARLRALATVTLDGEIAVHDVKIISGDERLFVAMPSRRMADGSFRDIVHPVSTEARARLEREILKAYRDLSGEFPTDL